MITVRAASDADKDSILRLFTEVFGPRSAERTARLWHWQWQFDPRLKRPGYRGVVAEWGGRIIGNVSYIPAALYVDGQPIAASWGVNVVIHWGLVRRALRGCRTRGGTDQTAPEQSADLSKGLAAALIDHPSNDSVQLGKHISEQMLAVTGKIGFSRVDSSGSWGRQLTLTPRVRRIVGGVLAPVVAWPANRMLPRIPKATPDVRLFEGDFDDRFDRLWRAVRSDYPVIGLRDAATLTWRFRRHPGSRYRVATLSDGRELRGYIVTSAVPRGRFLQGKIIDLLAARDDPEAVQALLGSALSSMRRDGVAGVDCYASHEALLEALKSTGFTARQKLHSIVIRGLPASGIYVTELDGDGG
jgi:Acetyltransferase (GNAT) domain